MNDANNALEQPYLAQAVSAAQGPGGAPLVLAPDSTAPPLAPQAVPPAPSPAPAPAASGAADLVVERIRVKGENAGSQDDCDPGDNDVTVRVKNQGSKAAGGFVVRLVVDHETDDADEQSTNGLAAGASVDLTFDRVKLKKDDRSLAATADAKSSVAESKEDNNTRSVSVSCKNEEN